MDIRPYRELLDQLSISFTTFQTLEVLTLTVPIYKIIFSICNREGRNSIRSSRPEDSVFSLQTTGYDCQRLDPIPKDVVVTDLLTQEASKLTCGQQIDVISLYQVICALNSNAYQHLTNFCLTQYQILLLGKSDISIHKSNIPEHELPSLSYTFYQMLQNALGHSAQP